MARAGGGGGAGGGGKKGARGGGGGTRHKISVHAQAARWPASGERWLRRKSEAEGKLSRTHRRPSLPLHASEGAHQRPHDRALTSEAATKIRGQCPKSR